MEALERSVMGVASYRRRRVEKERDRCLLYYMCVDKTDPAKGLFLLTKCSLSSIIKRIKQANHNNYKGGRING